MGEFGACCPTLILSHPTLGHQHKDGPFLLPASGVALHVRADHVVRMNVSFTPNGETRTHAVTLHQTAERQGLSMKENTGVVF